MIITAEDPQNDPLTVGVLPMAIDVAGGPVVRYVPGAHDYSAHNRVIYLGHGEPGAELTKVNSAQLIADLADAHHGLPDGATLLLWSCFATAGQNPGDSLVAKLTAALAGKNITVAGASGAMYSDTYTRTLWYGPTKTTKDATSADAEVIKAIEGHAWMESGMLGALPKGVLVPVGPGEPAGCKKVTAIIGGVTYEDWVKQFIIRPPSVQIALDMLLKNGKIAALPATPEAGRDAIAVAVRKWYEVFFGHRIIQAYIATGVITRWQAGGL